VTRPDPARLAEWRGAESAVDRSGMRAHVRSLPDQLEASVPAAAAAAAGIGGGAPPAAVAVLGMGGSAIAADLLAAYTGGRRRLPLVAIRDYRLPAWLGSRALAVASSYSGNTEETLAAWAEAKARGLPVVAVTTGGELARRARAAGDPVLELPGGLPPRAALGHSLAAVAAIVARVDPGLDADEEAARLLAAGERLVPRMDAWLAWDAENPALEIAAELARRLPVVVGGAPLGAAAAGRWRAQLNENAKLFAHSAELPEHNHNEIVALEGDDDFLARLAVVWLETPWDHPRVVRRRELARRAGEGRVGIQLSAAGAGGDPLESLLELCALGDCASFLAAVIRGVDPSPVRSIDRLKSELDRPDPSHERDR